jgi:hypothetical protein
MVSEKYYPSEENLGKDCSFWQGVEKERSGLGQLAVGCHYPKAELEGRLSCEGMIDDVCLFVKNGRHPKSLSPEQIAEIRFRMPLASDSRNLPPGITE